MNIWNEPILPANIQVDDEEVSLTKISLLEALVSDKMMEVLLSLDTFVQRLYRDTIVNGCLVTGKSSSSLTYPDNLTTREVEVLRLIAQGWTDAQIAEYLVISLRTANKHATTIYSKIGVSSRSAATRYAIEHRLV